MGKQIHAFHGHRYIHTQPYPVIDSQPYVWRRLNAQPNIDPMGSEARTKAPPGTSNLAGFDSTGLWI